LCEFSDDEWMNAEADAGETKREAIRDRYVPLMAPVFFPADPTKPDIVQLFASLLRVVGMEDKGWDPYAESRSVLNDLNALMQLKLPAKKFRDRELTTWRLGLLFYSHIVEMSAPYEVLANLLRFRLGKGYHPNPYYAFLTEQDRKRYRRSGLFPKKKIEIIQALGKEADLEIGGIFDDFYRNDFRNAIAHSDFIFTDIGFRCRNGYGNNAFELTYEQVDDLLVKAKVFIGTFFGLEREARRMWGEKAGSGVAYDPVMKGVMEILVDADKLMNGFKVHWPNGSESTYRRTENGIDMVNCMLALEDNTLSLMVGMFAQHRSAFSPLVEEGAAPNYSPLENGKIPTWSP
jgi:hypothetical protein